MVSVRIYVEGGGGGKLVRTKCRKGFSEFFHRTGFSGRMPKIVACGTRNNAYDDFRSAWVQSDAESFLILLVDSEGPVTQAPWDHLRTREGWIKPGPASDDNAHLMVQCMEAWFLADKKAMAEYYGQYFNERSLPANPKIEEIPKGDILKGLSDATRNTQKGEYDKGDHSFAILERLDPSGMKGLPHWDRLLDLLNRLLPKSL
jgi:hypothetical protein